MAIKNAFTVDVEEYFQVGAFEKVLDPADWPSLTPRLEQSMDNVLKLMDDANIKGTFFILGWIAERYPSVIKKLAAEGHEIASHGYAHQRATGQTQEVFKQDISSAKTILEDLTGQAVIGYRAPSFSFNKTNPWVYDVLQEAGHQYSSSIYPVVHDHYGVPDAPRFKYKTPQGLWELPLSTMKMGEKNIPISGGGYFRLYPYAFTRWAIQKYQRADGQPYIFYMHPWEADPDQPRIKNAPLKSKFRHYLNLNRVEGRLKTMFKDFEWGRMDSLLAEDSAQ